MKYFKDINEMIEEAKEDYENKIGHKPTDVEIKQNTSIYTFPQTWASTALGFDGYGCQAITTAQTTVIIIHTVCTYAAVFFGGKFAYSITNINEAFLKDISQLHIEPLYMASKYFS